MAQRDSWLGTLGQTLSWPDTLAPPASGPNYAPPPWPPPPVPYAATEATLAADAAERLRTESPWTRLVQDLAHRAELARTHALWNYQDWLRQTGQWPQVPDPTRPIDPREPIG